jgi:SAM-dependent methyltransferase
MLGRPVTPEVLERLRQERLDADRRYNDALTALDRAIPALPSAQAPSLDGSDAPLETLNRGWNLVEGTSFPPPRGLRSRLAHFVWSLVRPVFERQQTFNAGLVEHLNHRRSAERGLVDGLQALAAAQREQAATLAAFHVHLIQYLQQVTPYADTKDREVAGHLMAVYDAALNAMTDELLKRWESLSARDARLEGHVATAAALAADHQDLRASLALVQQSTQTLKRELTRVLTAAEPGSAGGDALPPQSTAGRAAALDSYKYVGFEDRFRGSQHEIRRRLKDYVETFAGAREVLDVGCGRGELLDLLREADVPARGVDLNHEMVEICRQRGLDATEGDWVGYLESIPDGSLGGLVAIQVVEHLDPSYLIRALELSYHKLRPGSIIVLETINPACWFAFFSSYVRDLTHQRPVHPETLQYLLTASGFQSAAIEYKAPYPEHEKLRSVPPPADATSAPGELAEAFNANVARLNALLFTHLDYAAVARRG